MLFTRFLSEQERTGKNLHWTNCRRAYKQKNIFPSHDTPCYVPEVRRKAENKPEKRDAEREDLRLLRAQIQDTFVAK